MLDAAGEDVGGEDVGGVIVFLENGRLALLEIYSYFGPVCPFSPLDRLRLLHIERN